MHASVPATGSLVDAYAPREIAHRVEVLGVTKAQSDAVTVLVLAILAGAFIALGALFHCRGHALAEWLRDDPPGGRDRV